MSEMAKYDEWFGDQGPAALVIREYLIPVEGADGVFFPATYAAQLAARGESLVYRLAWKMQRKP